MIRKTRKFRIFCFALFLSTCGCVNIMERSEGTYTTMGMECGSPYFCAPSPYYCTAAVAKDCLAAPYRWLTDSYADWGGAVWGALATLTYPFWIVDEVCEVALDTVFLPVDGIYEFCKDKPSDPQDQHEIIQDVTRSSHLCPANSCTQNNHSSGCGERRVRKGGILTNN